MLIQLSIKNFAVVRDLTVNFDQGLTAITGETGAGKSIAIDALSLCLGERADAGSVRKEATKAEIVAHFTVCDNANALAWLKEHELESEDDGETCFIRRVISKEGRSKAFVNGSPVSLQQLKVFGQSLLAIHGQNTHLQLLKDDVQRNHLDNFANHKELQNTVITTFDHWREKQKRLSELQQQAQTRADRRQLLVYQVEELDDFALADKEFEELETEHKRLSNGQALLEQAQTSFYNLYENDEGNALSVIQNSLERLVQLQEHDASLSPIITMLNDASIQVEEAASELRSYCDALEIDPLRLQQVESRYSKCMELARKHNIEPESLYEFHQQLAMEFKQLEDEDTQLETLEAEVQEAKADYLKAATLLSDSRQQAARSFAENIESQIQRMNMKHACVVVDVDFNSDKTPAAQGLDDVRMLVSTNPGQDPDRLDKVVSGGELSRIGLAIQVLASGKNAIPTMIFDEVDAGISGPTASIVGALLRKLGSHSQVMCVTHLPQVAAQAHNQLFVTKLTDGESTQTMMLALAEQERVDELARLLAGDKVTETALANARELLKNSGSN
ncbi:DNA repair protein RecN [Salinimonas chungwhensis]|uniref:DNA repair protein RecN n=1 Tax=Salinimonas chungwhensis TaxID=265425 RepID=UPI000368B7C0|nr:DNA repair protein RecN [Salinimonas chungwhensis]